MSCPWVGSNITNVGFDFGYSRATRCMDQEPGQKRKSFSIVSVHSSGGKYEDSVHVTHTKEGLYEVKRGHDVIWSRDANQNN